MTKPPDFICGKCGGAMDIGAIADNTYGANLQARWVEGEPKESYWWGLSTSGKAQFKVETYRCAGCGYLESYATEEAKHRI